MTSAMKSLLLMVMVVVALSGSGFVMVAVEASSSGAADCHTIDSCPFMGTVVDDAEGSQNMVRQPCERCCVLQYCALTSAV